MSTRRPATPGHDLSWNWLPSTPLQTPPVTTLAILVAPRRIFCVGLPVRHDLPRVRVRSRLLELAYELDEARALAAHPGGPRDYVPRPRFVRGGEAVARMESLWDPGSQRCSRTRAREAGRAASSRAGGGSRPSGLPDAGQGHGPSTSTPVSSYRSASDSIEVRLPRRDLPPTQLPQANRSRPRSACGARTSRTSPESSPDCRVAPSRGWTSSRTIRLDLLRIRGRDPGIHDSRRRDPRFSGRMAGFERTTAADKSAISKLRSHRDSR